MSRPGAAGSRAGRSNVTRAFYSRKRARGPEAALSGGAWVGTLKRHLLVSPNFPPWQEGWVHLGEGAAEATPGRRLPASPVFQGHLEASTPISGGGMDPRGQVPSSREVRLADRWQVPTPHPGTSPDSESFSSQSM